MQNVKPIELSEELKNNYLTYAEYVIRDRAIPDIRDGLKPVQRRILWSMWTSNCRSNSYYKKSARVVGNCMACYHAHGDSSIYSSLVRMSQNFVMHYPLIDAKGNFGSIDFPNSYASSRYTECRLSKFTEDIYFSDIDENAVDFIPNYDGNEIEPVVLPAKIPMILCTSPSGIAVGMTTDIPPHNLIEICNLFISRIKKETENKILKLFSGPDFPLGGVIKDYDCSVYNSGRGCVSLRSKISFESKSIIIETIPYSVSKEDLINSIIKAVKNGKTIGIKDLTDESDGNGIRIRIDIENENDQKHILENLYNNTSLQTNIAINSVVINSGQPKLVNLFEILDSFISFRKNSIFNKTKYVLEKLLLRKELVDAVLKITNNIQELLSIINNEINVKEITNKISIKFDLNQRQVEYVLEMPIKKLSRLDKERFMEEKQQLKVKIDNHNKIMSDSTIIDKIMIDDTTEIIDKYGFKRKTTFFC